MQVALTSQQVTQHPRVPREMRLKEEEAATCVVQASASGPRALGKDAGLLHQRVRASDRVPWSLQARLLLLPHYLWPFAGCSPLCSAKQARS